MKSRHGRLLFGVILSTCFWAAEVTATEIVSESEIAQKKIISRSSAQELRGWKVYAAPYLISPLGPTPWSRESYINRIPSLVRLDSDENERNLAKDSKDSKETQKKRLVKTQDRALVPLENPAEKAFNLQASEQVLSGDALSPSYKAGMYYAPSSFVLIRF